MPPPLSKKNECHVQNPFQTMRARSENGLPNGFFVGTGSDAIKYVNIVAFTPVFTFVRRAAPSFLLFMSLYRVSFRIASLPARKMRRPVRTEAGVAHYVQPMRQA
jgi:hypothetical protein